MLVHFTENEEEREEKEGFYNIRRRGGRRGQRDPKTQTEEVGRIDLTGVLTGPYQ